MLTRKAQREMAAKGVTVIASVSLRDALSALFGIQPVQPEPGADDQTRSDPTSSRPR